MRKHLFFLISLLSLMLHLLPVSADYIVEPVDNFLSNHQDECVEHYRYYTNPNPLDIYLDPDQPNAYHQAKEGNTFKINYLYTDQNGIVWGNQGMECWVKMDSLELLYSSIDFTEDYESSFVFISGEILRFPQDHYIALYEYPNSDWISGYIDTNLIKDGYFVRPDCKYVDENGTVWLRTLFADQSGWFKEDAELSTRKPEVREIVLYNPHKESRNTLTFALVGAACILTGIVSLVFKKKTK